MNAPLAELAGTLAEELRLQTGLLELARKKRDALVAVDTAAVDAITRREQSLLAAAGSTASSRLRLTVEAGRALALPPESGVTAIAARAEEPHASRLAGLAKELKDVLRELSRVTHSCRVLTEESLGFVKRFFRILGGADQTQPGYSRRGAPPAPGPARLLIDEVV
ncbi:MAG: flagellar protein FlgN [Planctomycetes bacterium]|nr:flagellar protein FlgN [Planctomycetota bacterium]